MSTGFQQQRPVRNHGFFKPAATPQHGQPADKSANIKEPRSFQPKSPGH